MPVGKVLTSGVTTCTSLKKGSESPWPITEISSLQTRIKHNLKSSSRYKYTEMEECNGVWYSSREGDAKAMLSGRVMAEILPIAGWPMDDG